MSIMKNRKKSYLLLLIGMLIGTIISVGCLAKLFEKTECKTRKLSNKHFELFLMMNRWVKIKQEGKNIASYFTKNGYQKIAIYGMSYVGQTLLEELKNSEIEVAFGIDKNVDAIYTDIDIIFPDSMIKDVDAIVVTAITYYDEIVEKFRDKVYCPIISLEDILYNI